MTTTASTKAPTSTTADPRRWTALVFIALAQLMVVLDATIVNIALPHAQSALHISDANRQWVITAYTLAFGGLLLFGGRIADLLGRKRTFLIGLIGFAGASAIGGAATDANMLFAARALQGAFGALLAPSALSMLAVMFTQPRERAKAFGIYGAIAGGGSAVGLILGGVLTQYLTWRWALYVNVPIAIIAFIGATVFVNRSLSARHPSRVDVPGAVLVTGGLVSLVYGFTRAESNGWRDHITLGAFGAAAVLIILFIVVEALIKAPLLPLRVVLDRNRGGSYLAVGLSVIAMFGVFLFLTYYLQIVKGYSPVRTGLAFLPVSAGMITGSTQISARLMDRVAPRLLMVPGLLVAGVGVGLLTRLQVDSPYTHLVLPAEILLGLGLGSTFMPAMNLATNKVSPADAGVASAMVNTSQQVGGSIGTALLNTIAATATTRYIADHAFGRPTPRLLAVAEVHGFTIAIRWAVGILLLAMLLVLVLVNAKAQHSRRAAARESETLDTVPQPAHDGTDASSPAPAALADGGRRGTEIHGHVRGGEGTAVPGAMLTLVSLTGRQIGRARTMDDGHYTLYVPDPGAYVLIATADGHQPQADSVVVGEEPLSNDLFLTGTANLAGIVRGGGGEPVPGATIVLTDVRGEVVASTATAPDGTFALQELVAGTFTLAVSSVGHRPAAVVVEVAERDTTRCEVTLASAARVFGTIRLARSAQPLPDARVTLVDARGRVVGATMTGADGTYAFTDLTAGDHTVIASGYPPVATPVTLDVAGQSDFDIELRHPEE